MQLEVLCPSCFSPQLFETSQLWHQIYELLFIRSVTSDSFWTAAHQDSLSFTISRSLLKLMSIESVMPSNYLILCCPLLLLPLVFPSCSVFSSQVALCIRWPKDWNFSFSISSSNEYSGLISFWFCFPGEP